jgi:hypothetical protein
MSKCVLSIELENPDAILRGGEKVRGHLRVDADADVRCRAVTVGAGWRTRGKGNVATGSGPKVTVFSGDLVAGQSQRFAFEVETLRWPATYNGFQFAVEHLVEATADIPWSFDPKVSVPIFVLPGETRGDDFPPPVDLGKVPQIAVILGAGVMGMFTLFMMLGPNPAIFAAVPVLVMAAIVVLMLVFKWLPKLYVGQVEFDLQPLKVSPGEKLAGFFSIRPGRTIHPEFIHLRLTATEVCMSGSGSKRTTHRHELFDRTVILADHPMLLADQTQRYEIATRLPPIAAYSIKVTDNELQWTAELRVGIQGLVDWKDRRVLTVVPPSDSAVAAAFSRALDAPRFQDESPAGWEGDEDFDGQGDLGSDTSDLQITFGETVGHIWAAQDRPDQIEVLVDAVAGIPMTLAARVDRRALVAGPDDPTIGVDEYLVTATYASPPLPLSLYIPKTLGDEFEQASGDLWEGEGEIVGWDRRGGRLQVRVYH